MAQPKINKQLAELVKCRDELYKAIQATIRAFDAADVFRGGSSELVGDDPCATERAARDAAFTVRTTADTARSAAEAVFTAADTVFQTADSAYQAAEQVLADCESQ